MKQTFLHTCINTYNSKNLTIKNNEIEYYIFIEY